MKIAKKVAFLAGATLLVANSITPVFARDAEQPISGDYAYSSLYANENSELISIKSVSDYQFVVDNDHPEAIALFRNTSMRDAAGDAVDVVIGLKNFKPFNSCSLPPRISRSFYVEFELVPLTDIHPGLNENIVAINLYSDCAGADFYINYYKAGTVDKKTGVGQLASMKNAAINVFGLNNSGEARDYDHQNNADIANYGEERIIIKNGNVDPFSDINTTNISIENNTFSALTLSPTASMDEFDYAAGALIDNINAKFSSYFSARDGEISILMTQFVGPYRPTAPVKSANKSEAEADEEINFTVYQYFPSQIYANSSLVTGAYLLFDDFYGYGQLPSDLKITNSNGEDVTDGVTIWTLGSDNEYLPNDTFYFFCNLDTRPRDFVDCDPNKVSTRQFFTAATNTSSNFIDYLANKIDMSSEDLYDLIQTMGEDYSLSTFFHDMGATEKEATKNLDINGQSFKISYKAKMPTGVEEFNSQVALVDSLFGVVDTEIGNVVTVRAKKAGQPVENPDGIGNPATADSIAIVAVISSIATLGTVIIVRKSTARR